MCGEKEAARPGEHHAGSRPHAAESHEGTEDTHLERRSARMRCFGGPPLPGRSLPTAGRVNETIYLKLLWMQKVPSDAELEGSFHLQWKQLMQLLLEVLDQPVHAATVAADSGRTSQNSDAAPSR